VKPFEPQIYADQHAQKKKNVIASDLCLSAKICGLSIALKDF
jgi:hypothetical protein